MKPRPRTPVRVVVHEGPGAAALAAGERFLLVQALLDDGHGVTRSTAATAELPRGLPAVVVVGRFGPGAAPVPLSPSSPSAPTRNGDTPLHLHDLGAAPLDDARARGAAEHVAAVTAGTSADAPAWTPWFPVIDYDRCTNCMQCLSFCLFDVYGVDGEGRIQVQNESNCKTSCPACSRVCPDVAILFPKYKKGPINGDVVRQEDVRSESMKVDISALLGGDIYSSLRQRSAEARQRFSTERDESKALLERRRCLKELGRALDVPEEVLMTLPSAGDIEERARRAMEKAEKRRARSQSVQDEARRRPATETEWGI